MIVELLTLSTTIDPIDAHKLFNKLFNIGDIYNFIEKFYLVDFFDQEDLVGI